VAGHPRLSARLPTPRRAWSAVARPLRARPQDVPRRARWGHVAAFGALAVVAALVFGVTTASVERSLGPHVARYTVTTDDLVRVDLGPLGTLEVDSPLPLTLGAYVRVAEIPAEVTAVDPAETVQVLSQDLQGYVQFFTGPQATIEDVARALVVDALQRALGFLVVMLVVGLALRALLGPARRAELAGRLGRHRGAVRGSVALAVAVAVTCVSSIDRGGTAGAGRTASAVFAGTELEGARITGRLAGVIDTYGGRVLDAYRSNETFYSSARTAVAEAWDERAQAIAAREDAEAAEREAAEREAAAAERAADRAADAADGPGPDDDAPPDVPLREDPAAAPDPDQPRGDDQDDPDEPGDEDPEPSPTPTPADEDAVEPTVLLLVSDLHCNIGMARIIREVAERSGADVVLNAGDTTVNGTSVERYCVTTFSNAVPDGVERVVADGNHDSTETGEHERGSGWTVLDGDVVTAAGVRILGDRDPNQTQIGGGTSPITDETAAEAGERLARTACDDAAGVDILLIHTPRVGDAAMRSGCVPVQLSGHQHRRTGPVQVGEGIRYVSSSTAGATSGQATVGPLNGVAELTVLRFDPESRRMIDLQLVSVNPDGSATVSDRQPFPVPIPAPAVLGPAAGDPATPTTTATTGPTS
jgi:predicted phosphodiesterase